jgi:hypothetical protein
MNSLPVFRKILLAIVVACAWFAIIFQFYLIIVNRQASIGETIIRFFSFFTILTNILVATCFTSLLFYPNTKLGVFFNKAATLTAVTVYIAVVGIIYNFILRFLWKPEGLQFLVDELLHSVVPILVVLYWIIFPAKEALQWKHIFPWLLYPVIYCLYVMLRGAMSGFYPYPFIDVPLLGYGKVFLNICSMVFMFLVLSLLFVGLTKLWYKRPGAIQ